MKLKTSWYLKLITSTSVYRCIDLGALSPTPGTSIISSLDNSLAIHPCVILSSSALYVDVFNA